MKLNKETGAAWTALETALVAQVADVDYQKKLRFGMSAFLDPKGVAPNAPIEICTTAGDFCTTAACLAGLTVITSADHEKYVFVRYEDEWQMKYRGKDRYREIGSLAGELLGLDAVENMHMFYGCWSDAPLGRITADMALSYVRQIIASESVFWTMIPSDIPGNEPIFNVYLP